MYEPYENQENENAGESVYHYAPLADSQPIEPQPEDTQPIETQPVESKPETPKPQWTAKKVVALTLFCSLLGGVIGAGGMCLVDRLLPETETQAQDQTTNNTATILQSNRENAIIDITQIDTTKLMTQAEVYAANVNSTVGITTSITTNFWGYQTTSAASGSGFVFSADGYILTNFHVIEDSDSITVSMYDGTTYDAKLIGYDESNDVAVLKIEAENLVPVVLGNSDQLNVGDSVIAIGNPLGELTFSLTSGSISAKDREITMSTGATMRLMQTDCAINSGNSGGALFNLYGEVIGITNAKYSSSSSSSASIDNIGFAIPINKARSIAESIIEKGYVSKPYVGLSVSTVSEETQSYGLPQGAAVRAIEKDSPAEQAGLKINDIITHVNGQAITGSSQLVSMVADAVVGDTFTLSVYRQGNTVELTLTVGEQIQSANQQQSNQSQNQTPMYPWGR